VQNASAKERFVVIVLDFRYFVPFRNISVSKATGVKSEEKFRILTPPCKILRRKGEMPE